MKTSTTLIWLSVLIALLALVAAGAGLFWQEEGAAFTFTTLRGQDVTIYGQGLYRYDTPVTATGFKMADVVTLVLAIPLTVVALLFYRRGSLRAAYCWRVCWLIFSITIARCRWVGLTTTSSCSTSPCWR